MEFNPKGELHNKRQWYSVSMRTAHEGTGSEGTHTNYVFAKNAWDARNLAKRMRGVKLDKDSLIFPLEKEAEAILLDIMREFNVPVELAKKRGLYGIRENADVFQILQERLAHLKK